MNKTIEDRFLSSIIVDEVTTCWNWTKYLDRDGYGYLAINRKPVGAHRVSYKIYKGEIPQGMSILHSCDNPKCCNPAHLRVGTVQDNQKDKKDRQRVVGSKHPYSKLTEEDVLTIRASPLSQGKLGKIYGVEQAHIGRIVNRVNWTHI